MAESRTVVLAVVLCVSMIGALYILQPEATPSPPPRSDADLRELKDLLLKLANTSDAKAILHTLKQQMSETEGIKSLVAEIKQKVAESNAKNSVDALTQKIVESEKELKQKLSDTEKEVKEAVRQQSKVETAIGNAPRRDKRERSMAQLKTNADILTDDRVVTFRRTTGPGIPKKFKEVLSTYESIDENAADFFGAAKAVQKMEAEVGWNGTTSNFVNPKPIEKLSFGENRNVNAEADGFLELDIVVPSIRDLDFLEDWKEFFFGYHLIIIQDGDPSKKLKIPAWADYELYNREDIKKALGEDEWIISSRDASIRNFGFLVSKKKYVYTIDDDCLPAKVPGGQLINVIKGHLRNLRSPSTPFFFNTLYDPYRPGADFVRGYPYSLRAGVPTAVSHGLWMNAPDYDAPTQLLKVEERNQRYADVTMTIPAGVLYPMCSMNVAFNRELIGPAFMQGLMGDGQPWARYDDMFAGWASKVVGDHLRVGTKNGGPYIWHNKASNPFTNLKKEYKGLFWQEPVIDFFDRVALSPSSDTPAKAYRELASLIREGLRPLHEYFDRLATAMTKWVDAWERAAKNELKLEPSRRSDVSQRRYAVFTIVKNEPIFLPYWLRHYRRDFAAADIYVITNGGNDTIPAEFEGVTLLNRPCEKYFDHHCIINIVKDMHTELFKKGYHYVVFSEADELVYAPNGLRKFLDEQRAPALRGVSFTLFHQKDEGEKDFDWNNMDVFSQRKMWFREYLYDKPFVTAVPLNYEVGFHYGRTENSADRVTEFGEGLLMIHLQRADYDYFIQRGEWKAKQNLHDDVHRGTGFQHKLSGQALIDFYNSPKPRLEPVRDDVKKRYQRN